jgi:lipase ATG15
MSGVARAQQAKHPDHQLLTLQRSSSSLRYVRTMRTWKPFAQFLVFVSIVAQITFFAALLGSFVGFDLFHYARQPAQSSSQGDAKHSSLDIASLSGRDGVKLRQILHHGAGQPGPRARRLDITPETAVHAAAIAAYGPFHIKTSPVGIDKPAGKYSNSQFPMSPVWISEDVPGPDVRDKITVLNFANMSEDAYKPDPSDPEWLDVGEKYNDSIPFGWSDSGIRGQVFADDTNTTVILSVKGTTVAMFEGNGTSTHDKENDNLFGSCCCGQGGAYLWRQVCDCQTGTYTCDQKCVKEELVKPNRYYEATLELMDEVLKLYPSSNIITTGHSLGGVLASFIGLLHGIPAVTFEAYPQALAAQRLGLPTSGDVSPLRRNTGGFHFGHTGDPVYMGTCSGGSSFCSIAGYAFETICHTGKRCVYDVVKDWGWRQSTSYHRYVTPGYKVPAGEDKVLPM